jgi:hypothetical protein
VATRASLVLATFLSSAAWSSADAPPRPADKASGPITHLDKKVDNWRVAETPNFRILHDQSKELVDKVGRVAEQTRVNLQKKWFGDVTTDWDGRCSIYLHPDKKKYSAKAGLENALGHTRTFSWGKEIQGRSIHLPAKQPQMLEDVLPHEISHSVLAVRYRGKTPRWADEGMACLAETPGSIAEFLIKLRHYKKEHGLFALEILMQTEEADHIQSLEYYSQSTSLVQFLTARKGPQTFTNFLHTCITKGHEPALQEHYGFTGYRALEKEWQAHAFGAKK